MMRWVASKMKATLINTLGNGWKAVTNKDEPMSSSVEFKQAFFFFSLFKSDTFTI